MREDNMNDNEYGVNLSRMTSQYSENRNKIPREEMVKVR